MGLYCKIDMERDWGFPTRTPQLGIYIDYTPAIGVFIDTFMKISQEMVPVDTGFLKKSLSSSGSGMIIEAEATADYAKYVEYGTWCCPAQPYFNPAVEIASDEAFKEAKRIYNEAILSESQLVQQQYIQEAQRMIQSASESNPMLGGFFSFLAMMIVVGIITLFREFFSDIFGPHRKDD